MASSSDQEQAQDLLSSRPPVTKHEAQVIRKIVKALNNSETFYLSGTLDLATLGVNDPTLFYSVKDPRQGVQAANVISLHKPPSDTLDQLHADCDPSPFGHGKETVYDESYRLARELQSNRFNLNFDPTAISTGTLAAVSAFTSPTAGASLENTKLPITGVEAKLYKFNSYTAGGHFKKHRDTPKSTNHIGTLLFGIPTLFEGGELILTHGPADDADGPPQEPQTITIDWSKLGEPGAAVSSARLPWVFFYSDVEHEILPVKSGHRLTIAYEIFATEMVRYRVPADDSKFETRSDTLYSALREALKDEEFLNKGGKLAFALNYQYPAEEMEKAKDASFDAILKGNDYLLAHTLAALSLPSEVRAVYEPEELPDGYYDARYKALDKSGMTGYPSDRFSSLVIRDDSQLSEPDDSGTPPSEGRAFFTASTFQGIAGDCVEEEATDRVEFLEESTDASVDWALIWARRPTKEAWAVASTFAQYGNYASANYCYVAGVLVVHVPAFGEGARKQN